MRTLSQVSVGYLIEAPRCYRRERHFIRGTVGSAHDKILLELYRLGLCSGWSLREPTTPSALSDGSHIPLLYV
ncbi:MAG: hypothetical protein N3E49_02345 [Bacteroidia bacterium]|nr:hypothetical protein [Bacteroidia bacterium]